MQGKADRCAGRRLRAPSTLGCCTGDNPSAFGANRSAGQRRSRLRAWQQGRGLQQESAAGFRHVLSGTGVGFSDVLAEEA